MDIDRLLATGVERRIIDDDQRQALIALRDEPAEAAGEVGDEERFQFVRSFDDVFLAIGVSLLIGGILGAMSFAGGGARAGFIAAALVWGIAEVITARKRRRIPSMIVATAFVLLSAQACGLLVAGEGLLALSGRGMPAILGLPAMAATLAAALFYARFRLPFSLLLLALAVLASLLVLLFGVLNVPSDLLRWAVLLGGVAIFAVAMRYDYLDPQRRTRFGDCAFWLHVGAAPMIMHAAMGLDTWRYLDPGVDFGAALVLLCLLALVALVVDRRALVVSGLIYATVIVGRIASDLASGIGASQGDLPLVATLVVLGSVVVLLSLGWRSCRNLLVGRTPLRRLIPLIPDLRR